MTENLTKKPRLFLSMRDVIVCAGMGALRNERFSRELFCLFRMEMSVLEKENHGMKALVQDVLADALTEKRMVWVEEGEYPLYHAILDELLLNNGVTVTQWPVAGAYAVRQYEAMLREQALHILRNGVGDLVDVRA